MIWFEPKPAIPDYLDFGNIARKGMPSTVWKTRTGSRVPNNPILRHRIAGKENAMFISDLDLTALTRPSANGMRVSLYMPTHKAGREKRQDPIRLRNMLRSAEKRLRAGGLRAPDVAEVIGPARKLIRTPGFWRRQDNGLAIFLSSGVHRHLHLPARPLRKLAVSRRFHITPLMALLYDDGNFCLLALSLNSVRLFWGTRDSLDPIETNTVPGSLADALGAIQPERRLQWHTRTGDITSRRRRAAVFHGQGGGIDDRKDLLLRFFRQVDRGMRPFLRGLRIPQVVAGVEYLLPIYRDANTYPHLSTTLPVGNPDRMRAEELHRLAWEAVKPIFAKRQLDAFDSYRRLAGAGDERTSSDLGAILPAAFQGRVETVFINARVQEWGSYDAGSRRMTLLAPGDAGAEDLLELAAVRTYLSGGRVFPVDRDSIPIPSNIAAQLRY